MADPPGAEPPPAARDHVVAGHPARLVDEQDAGAGHLRPAEGAEPGRASAGATSRGTPARRHPLSNSSLIRIATIVLSSMPFARNCCTSSALKPASCRSTRYDLEEALARRPADHRIAAEHERVHERQQHAPVGEEVGVGEREPVRERRPIARDRRAEDREETLEGTVQHTRGTAAPCCRTSARRTAGSRPPPWPPDRSSCPRSRGRRTRRSLPRG